MILLTIMLVACSVAPVRGASAEARRPDAASAHCLADECEGPLRALPIGDSYTAGFLSVGGWRPFVTGVDFVGPFCDEALADCEHAGISGRKLTEMAADAPGWVAEYAPDVVVLWGGYNDLARGATPEATVEAMASLVGAVGSGPRVVVVTTYRPHTALGATADAYTDALRTRAAADGWTLADVRAVTSDAPLYIEVTDNIHPTHRGYEAAGAVIDEALR